MKTFGTSSTFYIQNNAPNEFLQQPFVIQLTEQFLHSQ